MGRYLTTAIICEFKAYNESLKKLHKDEKEAINIIQQHYGGSNKPIFEVEKEKDCHKFRFSEHTIQHRLRPFLSRFYNDFYGVKGEYLEVLEKLELIKQPDEWENFIENETFECFQNDWDMFEDKINGIDVRLNYHVVMLTLEGKIMMESYGKHFDFFERTVHKAYADFPLAKLLRVYITG